MINLKELLICSDCKKEFEFKDTTIVCPACGKSFTSCNGVIDLLLDKKALPKKISKKEIIHKIKKRLLHPTNNPPFSYLTKRRIGLLYERYLNDRKTAEEFRYKYLPSEFWHKRGLVLDFGCGRGRHYAMLSQLGFDVVGLDCCSNGYWKRIYETKFVIGTDKELCFFKDNLFDICLCLGVLMYIEDDCKVIRDLYQLLKKDGFLILQVTNKENLRTKLTRKWLADEPFKRYYTLNEIKSKLEISGFVVKSLWTEKLYFPFFTQFLQFVFEILLPRKIYDVLSELTPSKFRGLINIVAQKC